MLSIGIYYDLEKLVMEMKGSEPADKMKRMGVEEVESGYILVRSKGSAFAN